ncbi:8806_t:CDS:2, partial [Ambispora leptoticha]
MSKINLENIKENEWLNSAIKENQIRLFDFKSFEIISPIGRGAFGEVFKAKWLNNDPSEVALKSLYFKEETSKSFIKELQEYSSGTLDSGYSDSHNDFDEHSQNLLIRLEITTSLINELLDLFYKMLSSCDNLFKISVELNSYLEKNAQNISEIIEYLKSPQADVRNKNLLGFFYYYGVKLDQDYKLALEIFQTSAQKDPFSQYLLGSSYLDLKDYKEAYYWTRRSAENHNNIGQCALG